MLTRIVLFTANIGFGCILFSIIDNISIQHIVHMSNIFCAGLLLDSIINDIKQI